MRRKMNHGYALYLCLETSSLNCFLLGTTMVLLQSNKFTLFWTQYMFLKIAHKSYKENCILNRKIAN